MTKNRKFISNVVCADLFYLIVQLEKKEEKGKKAVLLRFVYNMISCLIFRGRTVY